MSLETPDRNTFDVCDQCGERFEDGVRYPITTRRSANDELEIYSFCDGACQNAWDEDR